MAFNPDTEQAQDTNPTVPISDESRAQQQNLPFRLLKDEKVLGTFPITRQKRPLGRLASFLFVTDSRVIYAAEAKNIASSSTHLREYQVQHINGIEVSRHRGLDALGLATAIGAVLNVIGMIILAVTVSGTGSGSYSPFSYSSNPFAWAGPLFGFLAVGSAIVGVIAVAMQMKSSGEINVVGPRDPQNLARSTDLPKLFTIILLFLIFGIFIGIALIIWVILRELGDFKATDASLYADTHNLDNISYEVGALILDVQARGKFAGQE